jgi:hypothetical protein
MFPCSAARTPCCHSNARSVCVRRSGLAMFSAIWRARSMLFSFTAFHAALW